MGDIGIRAVAVYGARRTPLPFFHFLLDAPGVRFPPPPSPRKDRDMKLNAALVDAIGEALDVDTGTISEDMMSAALAAAEKILTDAVNEEGADCPLCGFNPKG